MDCPGPDKIGIQLTAKGIKNYQLCIVFIKLSHCVEIAEKGLLIKERDHEMM